MAPLNNADGTFEFAFNNPNFSDRVLQIEVTTGKLDDVVHAKSGDEVAKKYVPLSLREGVHQEENVQVLRVERFHVNSAILAVKSLFFLKLFSAHEREVTLPTTIRINASKFDALMELLHFMYGRKLPSAASQENFVTLLDLATLAHEYEVSSCIDHCIQLLSNMSMTHESASLCLEMASHVSVTCNIESLVVTVTEFLITRYKDVTVHEEELCSLTSAAIEVIFSRDDIQVPSEDVVYDIIMKWAKTRFPKAEERRVFLGSCITRIVRFPYMSYEKLRDILTCNDLDAEFAKNVVQEALSFKLEPLSHRWAITKSSKEIEDRRFIKRDYTKCIYNFDLSLDQCKKLKEVGKVASGRFYLGKQSFCLDFVYSSKFSLGVYLKRLDSSLSEITVRCKFSAMKKHETDFVKIHITKEHKLERLDTWGCEDLFKMTRESFIADDSLYFINDTLHLRAEVTLIQK